MNATDPMSADIQRQQDLKRKRKAILAGGVVLGLGAAVTLAAWSDDVFVLGRFETGTFELQGKVYGTGAAGYQNYDSYSAVEEDNAAGPLSFVVAPGAMTPGDTVYAPISIATSTASTTGASVTMTGGDAANSNALVDALTYQVVVTGTAGTCDASIVNGAVAGDIRVPAESSLDTGIATAFEVGAQQATPEHLCFAVTLPANFNDVDDVQGKSTGDVVWKFNGTSNEE